jgi:hypothetical protein
VKPFAWTKPQLDRSVILLNQIVEVFGRPDPVLISFWMFAESLFGRAMRGLIAIERDLVRQSALGTERFAGRMPWRLRRPAWRATGNRRSFSLCQPRENRDNSSVL